MSKVKLFGFKLTSEPLEAVYLKIIEMVKAGTFQRLVTLNPQIVVGAERNLILKDWIKSAQIIIADGSGITLVGKLILRQNIEKNTGIDLVLHILKHANVSIYCIGATPEVIEKATQVIGNQYPNIRIVGHHHGYMSPFEKESVCKDVAQKNPDIILVGMGFPIQEYMIQSLERYCKKGVAIGVGGVFDVLSGAKSLAPSWVRRCQLEWFFRGIQDPKKILTWGFMPKFLWVCITRLFQKAK